MLEKSFVMDVLLGYAVLGQKGINVLDHGVVAAHVVTDVGKGLVVSAQAVGNAA